CGLPWLRARVESARFQATCVDRGTRLKEETVPPAPANPVWFSETDRDAIGHPMWELELQMQQRNPHLKLESRGWRVVDSLRSAERVSLAESPLTILVRSS